MELDAANKFILEVRIKTALGVFNIKLCNNKFCHLIHVILLYM